MATDRSIGSLFVDIEMRTAKMESEMGKVRAILEDTNKVVKSQADAWGTSNSAIETKIARFGVLLLGARSMVQLLARDFRTVLENVEDIPGLPEATVASVQNLRHDLMEAHRGFQGFTADVEVFFYKSAKLMGGLGAALLETFKGRGAEAAAALGEAVNGNPNLTADQLARDRMGAVQYDKELASSKQVLIERSQAAARASLDEVHQIIALRQAQLDLMVTTGDPAHYSELEMVRNMTKAAAFHNDELTKTETIQRKLTEAESRYAVAIDKQELAYGSLRQRIDAFKSSIEQLKAALEANEVILRKGSEDEKIVALDKKVKLTNALTISTNNLAVAEKKYGEGGMLAGKIIADDLGNAILKGEGLHSLLNTLAGDLLKLILQRQVLGPLGDFLGKGLGSLFHSAAGGPIGSGPRIVGEYGPEIFNPGGSGTIIPNDKLGGGSAGNTYYIDASGADMAAVQRLERSLITLAGPGVVERRAIAAQTDANWRGGSMRRAMQGV